MLLGTSQVFLAVIPIGWRDGTESHCLPFDGISASRQEVPSPHFHHPVNRKNRRYIPNVVQCNEPQIKRKNQATSLFVVDTNRRALQYQGAELQCHQRVNKYSLKNAIETATSVKEPK